MKEKKSEKVRIKQNITHSFSELRVLEDSFSFNAKEEKIPYFTKSFF